MCADIDEGGDAIYNSIASLLPNGGWVITMQAGFDDGGKGDASLTCVAGYFVRDQSLVAFRKEWRAVLGGRAFHMIDLVHGNEDFSDLDDPRRQSMVRELIAVIKKHVSLGVAVSVETAVYEQYIVSESESLKEDLRKKVGNPFSMCAMLCIAMANRWMDENKFPAEETVYYFESGNRRQGEADNFLKTIEKDHIMDIRYNYVSHGFVKKNKLVSLDAADLLNWEWTQHCKRLMDEEQRPERESIKSLWEVPHIAEHFGRKNIRLAFVKRLLEPYVFPRFEGDAFSRLANKNRKKYPRS